MTGLPLSELRELYQAARRANNIEATTGMADVGASGIQIAVPEPRWIFVEVGSSGSGSMGGQPAFFHQWSPLQSLPLYDLDDIDGTESVDDFFDYIEGGDTFALDKFPLIEVNGQTVASGTRVWAWFSDTDDCLLFEYMTGGGTGSEVDVKGGTTSIAAFAADTIDFDTTYTTITNSPSGEANVALVVASATTGGVLTAGTQTIAGIKTFVTGTIYVGTGSNSTAGVYLADDAPAGPFAARLITGEDDVPLRLRSWISTKDLTLELDPGTSVADESFRIIQASGTSSVLLGGSRLGLMVGSDPGNLPGSLGVTTVCIQSSSTSNPSSINANTGGIFVKLDGGVNKLYGFWGDGTIFQIPTAGGGSGTVTSVGLAAPTQFSVSGSPVTGSGTLTLAWQDQTANTILAGPTTGSAAAPTFRSMVTADVPDGIITFAKLASAAVITESETIAGNDNDTTLPTSAAVKDYADSYALRGTQPGGRLTLATGTPFSVSDLAGISTLRYTPDVSDYVRLYDGTRVREYAFTERSLALSGLTSGTLYDVFLYDSSGTLTLELSAAWASSTTRTDALAWQTGLGYVKSGSPTRLWLGTFRATSTTTTESSKLNRFVWNAYNQLPHDLFTSPGYNDNNAATSWTFSGTTWSEANGGTGNRVNWITGRADNYESWHGGYVEPPAGGFGFLGLGEDSTTTSKADAYTPAGVGSQVSSTFSNNVSVGLHYLALLVRGSGAGTYTVYPDNGRGGGASDPVGTFLRARVLA